MAGELAVEVSSTNGNIKEQCGLDASPFHDLPKGSSVECNGVKPVALAEGIENGNGKEDADRTYVFVNGSDAVAESGDNDENFTKVAPVEYCVGNSGDLKSNGEIHAEEAKVNGCNGHCDYEKVDAVVHEAAENSKSMSHENGDCEKKENGFVVAEEVKGESKKSGPLEEVEVLSSAESVVVGAVNGEEKVEVESSFEVVEKVPEAQDDNLDPENSHDSKELSANAEVLPDQVESTSEIVGEVAESQAVASDCKEQAENAAELPVKVECTTEVVEVVPETHGDAGGSDDTEGSPKITEQLPLPVESAPEVAEEVPNSQSTVRGDADCSCDDKESSELAVDMPVEVESTSEVTGEISAFQPISHVESEATGNCKEQREVTEENAAVLSGQVCVDQNSEVVATDAAASKLAAGDNEEQVPEKGESYPIKEDNVEVSSQLSASAEEAEAQESDEIQADDISNDVEQQESVEAAAESSTTDQLKSADGDHDHIAESSACPESSNMNTLGGLSPSDNGQSLESAPAPDGVSTANENGDSADAIIETKEQDTAPQNAETLASPGDCINVSVESAEGHPTAEETFVTLHADVANAESEVGAQEGSLFADETSASPCTTNSTEMKICFGSISHEELSSISSEGRSTEVKSAADAAASQPSPDLESPQNDGGDKSTSRDAEAVDVVPRNDEVSPAEGSSDAVTEARPVVPKVVTKFFNYRVRLPRYDGEDLTIQLNEAEARVDEKTRIRDAIQAEIQMIRGTLKGYLEEVEAAAAVERSARDSFKSKRDEFDKLQSVHNKAKSAMSIDDIDSRIRSMEHKIEHETLALKEEKQLLRDIKLLKLEREQQLSRIGKRDDELKEALEQKESNEEHLKVLRKEQELLRGNVSRAEAVTRAAKKKQYDGYEKLRELQDQFKAADAVRQDAYADLQSLRKQRHEKNKYFYKYRDDARISSDLGSKGDRDGVSRFCVKQVEEFMELWHNNVEFRSDYIRCSLRGTLKRIGTKDGRSLGLDEQPPPYPSERIVKDNTAAAFPSLEQAKARAAPVQVVPSDDNVPIKPVEQKKQNSKAKVPAKPSEAVVLASNVAVRDDEAAAVTEEPKLTKEEEEKARKEEELRKEEEAARLKEQRLLEEKTKAEAALERKKRSAERAQARAAAKAQKEAEQKEKEREKRLKKKERKKAGGSVPADTTNEGEPTPSTQTPSETPKESETREKVDTIAKKPQKPVHFMKQTKVKSTIPPPLRNRGKRKMQPWMWVLIIAALILALFLAGNSRQLF